MGVRQLTAVLLVALGVVVAGSAFGAGLPAPDSPQVNESANATEGGFGYQVSSFMQASAADADASTERGMWRAAVNESENASDSVTDRVNNLDRRLQHLQNRSERLTDRRENGTIPEVAYNARASAIRAQIQNVRAAINETGTVAVQRGVNVSKLDRIRTRAANMTGPEVSALARNITDAPRGPPAGVPGGPPGNGGPGEGGPGPGGPGDGGPGAGGPGDGGPPDNPGPGANNSTEMPSPGTPDAPGSGDPGAGGPGDGGPGNDGPGDGGAPGNPGSAPNGTADTPDGENPGVGNPGNGTRGVNGTQGGNPGGNGTANGGPNDSTGATADDLLVLPLPDAE